MAIIIWSFEVWKHWNHAMISIVNFFCHINQNNIMIYVMKINHNNIMICVIKEIYIFGLNCFFLELRNTSSLSSYFIIITIAWCYEEQVDEEIALRPKRQNMAIQTSINCIKSHNFVIVSSVLPYFKFRNKAQCSWILCI